MNELPEEKEKLVENVAKVNCSLSRINWSAISTIVAVGALFTGFYTIYQTQQHNKQSVKPLVTAWYAEDPMKGEVSWYVRNAGLGPGIIKNVQIFSHREPVSGDITQSNVWQVVQNNLPGNPDVEPQWNDLVVKGDVLKDGDLLTVLTAKWGSSNKYTSDVKKMYMIDDGLVFAYCYCSVYGDCSYVDSSNALYGINKPLLNCEKN
ncbi:hypothetical protein QXB72_003263 [Vibrio fluvialis]|nr:hypothetical protein [Vibrio fluvialis]